MRNPTMTGRALATMVAATVAAAPAPLAAQGSRARCTMPDTTMEWARSQRAWLDDSRHDWSNDTLRLKLVNAAGLDASKPMPLLLGWTTLDATRKPDSAAVALLRAGMATRGAPFPTRSVVGAAGVSAVWSIIFGDSALEAGVMRRTMEAGLGEAFETETAMLEDRVRVRAGRGQLYGTLLRANADGTLAPARIEDSAHVDLRRESAWLPPLKQSVCAATAGTSRR
jgi:hypothetical protein